MRTIIIIKCGCAAVCSLNSLCVREGGDKNDEMKMDETLPKWTPGTAPEAIPEATAPEAEACAAHEPFALRVLGDSMEPEFPDGAIIIVDPSGVVENGSYVLAEVGDTDLRRSEADTAKIEQGWIFRQLVIEEGRHYLKPLNPGYATVEVSDRNAVKGVIVQKAGTRRRDRKHYC